MTDMTAHQRRQARVLFVLTGITTQIATKSADVDRTLAELNAPTFAVSSKEADVLIAAIEEQRDVISTLFERWYQVKRRYA